MDRFKKERLQAVLEGIIVLILVGPLLMFTVTLPVGLIANWLLPIEKAEIIDQILLWTVAFGGAGGGLIYGIFQGWKRWDSLIEEVKRDYEDSI